MTFLSGLAGALQGMANGAGIWGLLQQQQHQRPPQVPRLGNSVLGIGQATPMPQNPGLNMSMPQAPQSGLTPQQILQLAGVLS